MLTALAIVITFMCLSPVRIPNPNYYHGFTYRVKPDSSIIDASDDHDVSAFRKYLGSAHNDFYVGRHSPGRFLGDSVSRYLEVPCGHCAECRRKAQNQMVQRALLQATDCHVLMLTLTYRNEMLPSFTLRTVTEDGEELDAVFKYADIRDLQNMFKRIRKYDMFGRPFRYFFASEYGSKKHRPHFHVLLYLDRLEGEDNYASTVRIESLVKSVVKSQWVRNLGSHKKPDYHPLCEYNSRGKKSTFQCDYVRTYSRLFNEQTCRDGVADVTYYVSKYLLKFDSYQNYLHELLRDVYERPVCVDDESIRTLMESKVVHSPNGRLLYTPFKDDRVKFDAYWNLLRPHVVASKYFGLATDKARDYIQSCIDDSLSRRMEYPEYRNPVTHELSGLSKYYLERCLSADDRLRFYYNVPEDRRSSSYDIHHFSENRYDNAQSDIQHRQELALRFDKICKHLIERNSDEFVSDVEGTSVVPLVYRFAPVRDNIDCFENSLELFDDDFDFYDPCESNASRVEYLLKIALDDRNSYLSSLNQGK